MPNITPFSFDGAAVRTMNSIDLLDIINRERIAWGEEPARRNHFADRVKDELEGDHYQILVVKNPNGTMSETYSLTIDQCMLVAMRESKGVRRNVLAQLKASPVAAQVPEALHHADNIAALEAAARMLNASESGKLMMLRSYANANAPALLPALPGYAVDAPVIAGANAVSSEVTMSATALLQEHQAGMSAKRFNKLAKSAGLLTEVARQTSKGGTKLFSVVTEAGLAFGKNLVSPQSPRETQPHWFVDRFAALLEHVGVK